MSGPLIELRGVTRRYVGPPLVDALGPVDLAVETGDYVAVVGPSGSGKSTLMNILGLLDRPSTGRYLLDGYDTGTLSERERTALRGRRIGFVFQAFHLLRRRTAVENVALATLYRGTPRPEREALARDMLARVGLAARADALAVELSGGEQQRVAIARAIAAEPALLLCDEPTGSLDQSNGAAVLDLIERLRDEGMTICMITHDPGVAARAARVLSVRDGAVSETAPTGSAS